MSPLSNATTLANYASGIGTQGATLEVQTANKRVGIGTTNPQGPEGSLQVGTAVTISGNSGIVSATTFHGDFGSSTSVAGNLTVSGVITYEDVTNIDSIGIMTARSDLSIADKIIHTGDTNTALRFPAADTVTVETGGTERLRIDSSGNILSGKTSENLATAGFQHRGDAIGLVQITRDSGEPLQLNRLTDDGKLIEFRQDTTAIGSISVQGSDLGIDVNGSERVRIDSSGRLLLGTTTEGQTNADNFTVAENGHCGITIRSSNTTTGNLFFSDATSGTAEYAGAIVYDHSTDSLELYSGGGIERMRLDSSGRLLIGKTSGAYEIDIGGVSNAQIRCDGLTNSGQRGLIYAYNGTNFGSTGLNVQTGELRIRSGESGQTGYFITFGTGGTERMRIDSSGDMGLGTNSPSAKLHVSAAYNETGLRVFAGGAGYSSPLIIGTANGGEYMRVDDDGRLLVGTSSARTKYFNTTSYGPLVNFEGNNNSSRIVSFIHNDSSGGPMLVLGASGGSTAGNNDLINPSTTYGFFSFQGTDGTDLVEAARISAIADGTPAANDMPGALLFYTTADGAAGPTERMRINSSGSTKFTPSSSSATLQIEPGTVNSDSIRLQAGGTTSTYLEYRGYLGHAWFVDTTERMRLDSSGNIVIGSTTTGSYTGYTTLRINNNTNGGVLELSNNNTIKGQFFYDGTLTRLRANLNTALSLDTNDTERMRITSGGSLLIGTSTASSLSDRLLTVGKGNRAASYIELRNSIVGVGGLLFSDGTSGDAGYRGQVDYAHNIDEMRLWTAALPRLRIQGDGAIRIQPAGATSSANMVIDRTSNDMRIKSQIDGSGSSNLIFQTQSSGSLGTRGKFTSAGLEFPSGLGISFGPTGDTSGMTSELLDDYEEGTCTMYISTSGGGLSILYGNQTAYYVKIGQIVTVSWYSGQMNISNAGSGIALIQGFPYTTFNGSDHYAVMNIEHATCFATTVSGGYITTNTTQGVPIQPGTTNGVSLSAGSIKYLMMTATYRTN